MNLSNTLYDTLKNKIIQTLATLKLRSLPTAEEKKHAGRPLALQIIDILTLGVFRAEHGIETKQDLHNLFNPACSYKTLVVNLNRFALTIMALCIALANENRKIAHVVKYTDSTDVPVCLVKNARRHKTMHELARWGKTRKGWFYGLKWHLTVDAYLRVLSFTFTPGNRDDRSQFMRLNELLDGVFVADAGYVSEKLAREFYREGIRILFAKPLRKMKKLATKEQNDLYSSRARIETVFRHLKMFEGFVSSLPRSVDGYLANYFYALAAFMLNGVERNPRLLH